MTILEWFGIVCAAIIAVFILLTVLSLVAWNALEYGLGGGCILMVLTIIGCLFDLVSVKREVLKWKEPVVQIFFHRSSNDGRSTNVH